MTKPDNQKIKNIIYNSDGINVIFENDDDDEKKENNIYNFPKIIIKKSENNNLNTNTCKNMSIEQMIDIMHR